jgi:hypothetical protein
VQHGRNAIGEAATRLLGSLEKKRDLLVEVPLYLGAGAVGVGLAVTLLTGIDEINSGRQPNQPIAGLLKMVGRQSLPEATEIKGNGSSSSFAKFAIDGVPYTVIVRPKPLLRFDPPALSKNDLAGIAFGISKLFYQAQQNNPSVRLKTEDGIIVTINPINDQGCRSIGLDFTLVGNHGREFKPGTQIFCNPGGLGKVNEAFAGYANPIRKQSPGGFPL